MLHSAVDIPTPSNALTVETVSSVDEIFSLADDWRALERQATAPVFFQTFGWSHFIAQTLEQAAPANSPGQAMLVPRVVVVRDAGRVVLIWPLAVSRVLTGRVAQDLTEPFGQYSDALIAPDQNTNSLLDVAWGEIKRWGVDALMLQRVRDDAHIARWLGAHGRNVGEPREAPFVDLTAFATFDDYHKSIRAKTRKNLRNYRNRLARSGALQHRLITDREEIRDLTRLCLTWRSDWLSATGLSSTAFEHNAFDNIIDGLAQGHDGAPPLQLMMLALEGPPAAPSETSDAADRIIAIQWGFRQGGRYYAFMSAKNPSFDGYSPGRLHLEDVIQTCAREGVSVVDLLVPRMPYKETWATGTTTVKSFGLPITMRGRLIVDVWHNVARPALKSAVLSLPPAVRRLAFRDRRKPLGPRAVQPGE